MSQTILGLFDTFTQAQAAIHELEEQGFSQDAISVLSNDTPEATTAERDTMNDTPAEQAGSGAVAGATTGAGLGLLAGLAALAVPGIGPVLAAGPLAALLGAGAAMVAGATALGAGLGAASGALIGPLVDAGIPRPEAEVYNEAIRQGGTLVVVHTTEQQQAEAASAVMAQHHAADITARSEALQAAGWSYEPAAEPYAPDEITTYRTDHTQPLDDEDVLRSYDAEEAMPEERAVGTRTFTSYEPDFRQHYERTYAGGGSLYGNYSPVYHYGYALATNSRYRTKDWADVEPEAQAYWERQNPDSWDTFKEGVRYAWEKVRGVR